MGTGIALQIGKTPGMRLALVADQSLEAAYRAAAASGQETVSHGDAPRPGAGSAACIVARDGLAALQDPSIEFDVLVEATNAVGDAARYCRAAIARSAHVVLMNAEVDLALGPLLQHEAGLRDVVVTSDGGDQHGVLKRMIDDIALWGFRIVQAGNIKGFLDRYATAEGLVEEAAKRYLNPIQCCAYTDGTKLNIEMALLANGTGLVAPKPGMTGPACADVREVLTLFDFRAYGARGHVDYILGAEPGGGVYVVGHCDDALQKRYLDYYKMGGGPYYLFYRPYHLCHLETPRVIAEAVLNKRALLEPKSGLATDVIAYAKRTIKPGTTIDHGIGGDCFYGLIENREQAVPGGHVPIVLLEPEDRGRAVITREINRDEPLHWDEVDLPESYLVENRRRQDALLDMRT